MASGILFDRRIKGEMAMQGLNVDATAAKIGKSKNWLYYSMREPSKMALGDFIALCKTLHLDPVEVLNENILYRGGVKK